MNREITVTRLVPDWFSLPQAKSIATHPVDVLNHPDMSVGEKRAMLAAWASDACVVVDSPGLRQLPSGTVVELDEIMDALRSLDERERFIRGSQSDASSKRSKARRKRHSSFGFRVAGMNDEKDGGDDGGGSPPSAPAIAFPKPEIPALREAA
jgi:hypothetical protein